MGASGTVSVAKNATFNLESDGTGNKTLMMMGNTATFNLTDAKRVNLQFNETPSNNARLISMGSSAGKLNAAVQDVQAWNRGDDIADAASFNWNPMFNMVVSFSTYTTSSAVGDSIDEATITSFNNDFKTQNFRRVLFEAMPDIAVKIDNALNDNPASLDSRIISGTTNPNAYVRITGDQAIPVGTVPSPVVGSSQLFTIKADNTGKFSYELPAGEHLTAENTVSVDAFLGGKWANDSRVVLDQTPPVVETREMSYLLGDAAPIAESFITSATDSNPNNAGFTYAYGAGIDIDSLMNQLGGHQISIEVTDAAGNTTTAETTLRIFNSLSGIEADDVSTTVAEISGMDTAALTIYLLNQGHAYAWKVENNHYSDLSDKITISDFGGLTAKSGKYLVTLFISASEAGTANPLTATIEVVVNNSGPTAPTNPTNPGSGEASERENDGTGNTGALRLDYAPSKFDFGSVGFSFKNQLIQAKPAKSTQGNDLVQQWLQVSDNRLAENGWSVTVSQNGPLTSTSSNRELTGAILTIPKGTVYNEALGNSPILNNELQSKAVTLSTDEITIFSAEDSPEVGKNISTNVWQATDVSLKVPGGTGKVGETYENTINWSLVAGVTQ